MTAVLGHNGSGKSTIMSIAAGMQKADSGEMLYDEDGGEGENPIVAKRSHTTPKGESRTLSEACPFINIINNGADSDILTLFARSPLPLREGMNCV